MFDLDTLNSYASRGLIKSSARDGYTVWCYTQECVVTHQWDDVTKACRGLIMSDAGELVARPLPKFFNHDQAEAVVEGGPFFAYDKMDGTLIVVGEHNGNAVVSTKGSFDTWHSEAARGLLLGFVPPKGVTVLFEFIHPENRIVIDYGDYTGLVFLTALSNETGEDLGRPNDVALDLGWHGDAVVERSFHLQSMITTIQNPEAGPNREGFVVAWPKQGAPWNRVKLKFDLYVKLHGIYTGLTNRRVWECMMDETIAELLEIAPDEFHPAIKELQDEIEEQAWALTTAAQVIGFEAQAFEARKDAAAYIIERADGAIRGLAFKALDGKPIFKEAVRLSRPETSRFVGTAGLS